MTATLSIKLEDFGIEEGLARLMRGGSDLTPLMRRIGTVLETSVSERFEKGKGPGGEAWPPSIRVKMKGGQTLIDTARLRDSIVSEPDAQGVDVGTNVPYAATHQFGAFIEPKSAGTDATGKLAFTLPNGQFVMVDQVEIPARPFLGFDAEDEEGIRAATETYLRGLIN